MIVNTLKKAAIVCGLCAAVGIPALASGIEINVYTALAPNAFGSPSYNQWRDNAIYALEHGLDSYGTPGTPSYYEKAQGITPYQYAEVTSFNSWLGQSDPGTVFGPAFANELGERAAFPLVINGNGTQFSIDQLSFTMTGSDIDNSLGWIYPAGSYAYSNDYVGILKGDDGTLFTGDDVYITSGAASQLVDGLVGRGSGNALWPCGPGDASPCTTPEEQQAAIDAMVSVLSGSTFTGTYTLGAASGSAEFQFSSATPEPGTWILMFGSLAAVAVLTRRRVKA
jgi:hypothetical protein